MTLANVHGAPENDPDAVPVLLNETVPAGADGVPEAVSFTNAVQVVACATTIDVDEQLTLVEVDLVPPTVTVLLVPLLPRWLASVEVYVALAITVPAVVGVKVTAQLEVVVFKLASVHGDPVKDPAEVPVLVKATVPAGADGVPEADVSLTNAVHVVA